MSGCEGPIHQGGRGHSGPPSSSNSGIHVSKVMAADAIPAHDFVHFLDMCLETSQTRTAADGRMFYLVPATHFVKEQNLSSLSMLL